MIGGVWNQGLTQDQINAGWSHSPDGVVSYNPVGIPIIAFAGAGVGLVLRGLPGAVIEGAVGFLLGRTWQAQSAMAIQP